MHLPPHSSLAVAHLPVTATHWSLAALPRKAHTPTVRRSPRAALVPLPVMPGTPHTAPAAAHRPAHANALRPSAGRRPASHQPDARRRPSAGRPTLDARRPPPCLLSSSAMLGLGSSYGGEKVGELSDDLEYRTVVVLVFY